MSVTITPLKLLKKLKGFNKKSKNVKFHGTVPAAMEPEFIQAKPFETIPGPKPLPVPFGNLWNFTFGEFPIRIIRNLDRFLNETFLKVNMENSITRKCTESFLANSVPSCEFRD